MSKPLQTHAVAVGVIIHDGRILLLHRSPSKRHSPDLWEFVGGFIREKEAAEDTVLREVREETGLTGTIERSGASFEAQDQWGRWVVIPFLIRADSNAVKLSQEHTEYRWIKLVQIPSFHCVASVGTDLKNLGLL